MIGDHQQLRPKCQHYPLTVESNRGFDLNRSLFERLAIAPSFCIATLRVQHRMHPDISIIPKLVTYSDLSDAVTVSTHPPALGLNSRVIFINHDVPEDEDHCGTLQSVSKTNAHERGMILKSVQYLLRQGYDPGDLVVLTPYLGQMMKLQFELGKHLNVSLDNRDLNEARERFRDSDDFSAELAIAKKGNIKSKPAVRVATIDNYQGEEANIVLISLVRSNASGQIGFLKEPERVNVMLSRARDCEIIIGNRATLEQAKGTLAPLKGGLLWKKIFSHLQSNGQIFQGLPVTCQNHGLSALLTCPQDFVNHCRHGGCMKKCMKERECDHPCQMYCHPGACPVCRVMVPDVCSRGHPLKKQCSADVLPKCLRLIYWVCPMGHPTSGPCFEGKFGKECGMCVELNREEEERVKREEELNQILSQKHESLTKIKNKIELAKQSKAHQEEIQAVEAELALAERELDEFFSIKDNVEEKSDNFDSNTVSNNVLLLLQKQNPVTLSSFPARYKEEFGSTFAEDAEECILPKRKKRRKLKEILLSIPFCEVATSSLSGSESKKRECTVCLRDDYNKDSKVQKLDTADTSNNNDDIETVSVVIGGNILEYGVNSEDPQPSSASPTQTFNTAKPSILPPMPRETLPPESAKCDEVVAHVLNRYISEGPLKADDLLDEVQVKTEATRALRFMIELELNPGSSRRAPEYKSTSSNLVNAVCLAAKAIDFQNRFPLQAREFAQTALSLIGDQSIDMMFPENWADDLKLIGESAINPTQSSFFANSDSVSPDDAWLEIKRNDPKAPEVMSVSILPMIGLASVKESLIGMYHRFQLAKEQGDGAASSYNIRFEGNPG